VAEVMVETLVLTIMGGVLGIAVGSAGIQLLQSLGTDQLPLGTRIVLADRAGVDSAGHTGCSTSRPL
jgi:ABC-type antimicrobial peptide transport system permease subunit